MSLTTRYGFADTPHPGNPSLAWTLLTNPSLAGATSIVLDDVSAFPSATEFDIEIGERQIDGTVSNLDQAHVLSISGNTLTLQSALTYAHAAMESVYHTVTALGLKHNPQALTDVGDIPFLNSSARMDRLPQPGDGDWILRWLSGVPSYISSSSLYVPLTRTVNGHDLNSNITVTASDVGLGSVENASASGLYVPLSRTVNGHALSSNVVVSATDLTTGTLPLGRLSAITTTQFASAAVSQWSNDSGYVTPSSVATFTNKNGAISQWTNDSGYAIGSIADTQVAFGSGSTIAGSVNLTWVPPIFTVGGSTTARIDWRTTSHTVDMKLTNLTNFFTVTGAGSYSFDATVNATAFAYPDISGDTQVQFNSSGAISGSSSLTWDTDLHVNGSIVATATSVTAFTNKSGAISQWTNDSGYTTATSVTAFTNKSGNISQWTNDSGYLTSVTGHNVLSSTHSDTFADSVVRGDLLYGNSTPKWARLPKPSVLSGLSHDGTDVSWVTATGTGAPVRANSPTITTPTIASFANATHTHLNAAGGGTITAAAVSDLGSATVAFTNKSGAVTQWTNDASYTTLAAVAGVGYITSVTAHNLLSATHGDTTASAAVRGDIITGQAASPLWKRLAIGAANAVVSSDGTDVLWVASTGTGNNVRATSPTLVTPALGVATATSLNGNSFTTGTYTLTGTAGKTLSFLNTLTLAGTDATTMTFPTTSAAVARTDAGQTFTGAQVISGVAVGSVPLTLTAPIQTTDIAALSIAQTWNNAGINFTGAILLNVTNTNSAYESKLINLRVGGTKIFSVDRNGSIQLSSNGGGSGVQINANTNQSILGVVGLTLSLYDGSTIGLGLYPAVGVLQRAANYVGWTSSTDLNGGSVDLTLFRDAANALAQRNGTAAQTSRIYETYTDASNYSRLAISAPSGGPITFASEAAGTGTARSISLAIAGTTLYGFATNGLYSIAGDSIRSNYAFAVYGTNPTTTAGGGSASRNIWISSIDTYYGVYVSAEIPIGWSSATRGNGDAALTADTLMVRGGAAATLQLGLNINGAAVSQTLQAANAITGSNLAGGNLTLRPGAGTGTGTISALIFQSPTLGSTGTTAQVQTERGRWDQNGLTIADAHNLIFSGTTGTKFGTATSQKMAWWNATPVIQQSRVGQLTDSTTGTPATTLVDVGVVFSQAAINNNFSSVLTKLNALDSLLHTLGLTA